MFFVIPEIPSLTFVMLLKKLSVHFKHRDDYKGSQISIDIVEPLNSQANGDPIIESGSHRDTLTRDPRLKRLYPPLLKREETDYKQITELHTWRFPYKIPSLPPSIHTVPGPDTKCSLGPPLRGCEVKTI